MNSRSNDERLRGVDDNTFIFAKLSTHEFILEVLLADALASYSEEEAAEMGRAFAGVAQRAYGPISADPEAIAHMQKCARAMAALVEQLVDKALRRSEEIRGSRG